MRPAEWDLSGNARAVGRLKRWRVRSARALRRAWQHALPVVGLILFSVQTPAAEPVLKIDAADFVLDASQEPPPAGAAWQPQSLPDNWNVSRPGVGGNAWYRLHFDLPEKPDTTYAIYVRKLSMNAGFHVNGSYLGSGGRFEEPVARHWNRPLLFAVPPSLLKSGANTLHVRLWAYPNSRGGLGVIRIGPEAELRPDYERRLFIQTILPQLCNIAIAVMGLCALAFWIWRRNEAMYGYFFVFASLWTVRSTHLFIRDIPVAAFYWDIWALSSFGWCALLFIVLTLRFTGLRWPRFETGLAIYAVTGPFLMYLAGPAQLHAVANNWSFVIVPVAIFFDAMLIREALRQRTLETMLLAAAWGLVIAASIHDGLVHRDKLPFESHYLVSYVMILLACGAGWLQTTRFVAALNASERLNLDLEKRVAQKHSELERNFQLLQEMERQTVLAEERQRLMSEMHDGIGSRLIVALDLVERGDAPKTEVAGEIRECLDSLRLSIDSLEETGHDLLTLLGNVRYRLESRLKRQAVRLDWQVRDVPKVASLTPSNVLHVLRILQEAFTNILKHARARTITVETGFTDRHVFIRVVDDGVGFSGTRQGRGLVNMRRRARALDAELDIVSSPAGTALNLYLPWQHEPSTSC